MKAKVYLAPYNDISLELSRDISFREKYHLSGFIDKHKKDCSAINKIVSDFDFILICSPNYFEEIYGELLSQGIEKRKILFYIKRAMKITDNIEMVNFYHHNILDSYEKIKELKDKHKNKRAFLIGNGPSLQIKDLELLKDKITFAANKIYLAYEKTDWRPTYYLVEDDLVYKQNYKKIAQIENSIKLFPQYALDWDKKMEKAIYFSMKYKPNDSNFPQFNPDPLLGMYWGSTVIFSMIQWAIYMGIKEIYLLGVDFNFTESKSYVINEYGRKDLICDGEINHFHKDYREIGEKWNLPNLDVQLKTYAKAKEYCDANDIKIYNASRETKLMIFETINLDIVFYRG